MRAQLLCIVTVVYGRNMVGTRNGAQGLLRESKLETHSEGRNEIVGADKISESREKKMEHNTSLTSKPH